jgi:hypothetical protein
MASGAQHPAWCVLPSSRGAASRGPAHRTATECASHGADTPSRSAPPGRDWPAAAAAFRPPTAWAAHRNSPWAAGDQRARQTSQGRPPGRRHTRHALRGGTSAFSARAGVRFLRIWRPVSRELVSAKPHLTTWAANSRHVHRAGPAGDGLQATAIPWASCVPGSWRRCPSRGCSRSALSSPSATHRWRTRPTVAVPTGKATALWLSVSNSRSWLENPIRSMSAASRRVICHPLCHYWRPTCHRRGRPPGRQADSGLFPDAAAPWGWSLSGLYRIGPQRWRQEVDEEESTSKTGADFSKPYNSASNRCCMDSSA